MRWIPSLCLSFALCACAGTGGSAPGEDAANPPPAGSTALENARRPATSPEVMHRVWSAELVGAQGELTAAAEHYLAAALESDDPEISRRAVEIALAARAWQFAGMAADRWVLLEPDSLEARQTAVRALLLAGDYVQAEYQLGGLLDLTADEPWGGWEQIPELLGAAHDGTRADRLIQSLAARRAAARNPYALLARSQAVVRGGRYERAVELADQAIAAGPEEVVPQVWAGRLAMTRRDPEAALTHYRRAWMLRPDDRDLALAYAELLRQTGASAAASEVVDSLPDTPANRFTRIAMAVEDDDLETARALYSGFEELSWDDGEELALQAGRAAELIGEHEQAMAWYARLDGTEREFLARVRRAFLAAELGRVDEARGILLIARNDGSASEQLETYLIEAQILMDRQAFPESVEVLDRALEQFPGDTGVLYTRALAAVGLDRIDDAERDLRAVLAAEPDNAGALNALGYTLADQTDRFEEAESLIRAAWELEPDEPAIIDSMGWVAYRLGRLGEAETYLRQAFLLDRNAEIAAHLGEVLWAQGRKRDARAVWEQGMKIDADDPVLRETLRRLGVDL